MNRIFWYWKDVFTYCLRVFEVRVGMATVVVLSLFRCLVVEDWKWVVMILRLLALLAVRSPENC
jgi:hypothetical protein